MSGKKDKIKDKDRFSILVPSLDRCALCGSTSAIALHEVFFGSNGNRSKSKEDGMVLPLCGSHHNMSNFSVHFDHELDLKIKQNAEKVWINTYTDHKLPWEDRVNLFIKRFGKNYLD